MICEAIPGLLISTDVPMAQFILNLNKSMPNAQKFVLAELDDTHIFVQEKMADTIREKVKEFRDSNNYQRPQV